MFVNKQLLCMLIIYYFLGINYTNAQGFSYENYRLIESDYFSYLGTMETVYFSVSQLRCSVLCTINVNCIAFGYGKTMRMCELYNALSKLGQPMTRLEWNWFATGDGIASISCPGLLLLFHDVYPMRFVTSSQNHDNAEAYCSGYGEHLVKLTTQEKLDFIQSIINVCPAYQSREFWIGATCKYASNYHASDAWKYHDGTILGSFAWCPGKPGSPSTQQCARLDPGNGCDLTLNDYYCNNPVDFICEP